VYREWRGFTRDFEIEERLQLGDLYQLPVKRGGPTFGPEWARYHHHNPVRYNVNEDLADD
jgi:hypothetical protein